jgi:hypothetical protein
VPLPAVVILPLSSGNGPGGRDFLTTYPPALIPTLLFLLHNFNLSTVADTGNMDQQEHHAPAGHYSGNNRIPNIKQFMEGLDKDKKKRDAQIEAEQKQNRTGEGEVKAHHNDKPKGKNRRTVRDPVTGKDVEIDDTGADMVKEVDDPHVSHTPFF